MWCDADVETGLGGTSGDWLAYLHWNSLGDGLGIVLFCRVSQRLAKLGW